VRVGDRSRLDRSSYTEQSGDPFFVLGEDRGLSGRQFESERTEAPRVGPMPLGPGCVNGRSAMVGGGH
jgi:hypothetical protein